MIILNCEYEKKCNACQLHNLEYKDQLKLKNKKIKQLIEPLCDVLPIIGMDDPFSYRNKAQAVYKITEGKTYTPGIYKSKTKSVMPFSSCRLYTKRQNEIINEIAPLLKSFKIKPYDFHTKKGALKSVLIREGFRSGEIMVVLVLSDENTVIKPSFVTALIRKCPYITTIVTTVNTKDILLTGDIHSILYGEGIIRENILDKEFVLSANSFFQINPVQTEILYKTAVSFADIAPGEKILDGYCGVGTIGIIASDKAKKVISVEINKEAIKNAETNAKINNVNNITFLCGDVKNHMENIGIPDTVFIDPPRTGCDRAFLRSLVSLSPKKIVYVSCNPDTLQKDLLFLKDKHYLPKICQPVDMFPFTNHVETVVLITRAGS